MIASDAAELLRSAGAPPTMSNSGGPPAGAAAAPGGGKTVMLSPSEGVVSFAMGNKAGPTGAVEAGGASLAFWMICLSLGIALGAGAYFLMLVLSK